MNQNNSVNTDNACNVSCNVVDADDFANENNADSESATESQKCVAKDVSLSDVAVEANKEMEVNDAHGYTDNIETVIIS